LDNIGNLEDGFESDALLPDISPLSRGSSHGSFSALSDPHQSIQLVECEADFIAICSEEVFALLLVQRQFEGGRNTIRICIVVCVLDQLKNEMCWRLIELIGKPIIRSVLVGLGIDEGTARAHIEGRIETR